MSPSGVSFDEACELLESVLTRTARDEILSGSTELTDLGDALVRLRSAMRSNTFRLQNSTLALDKTVKALDNRTREDGFHALHDWDGKADRLNKDIIPVDVLHFFLSAQGIPPNPRVGLAILIDYYFLYLLAMLSLRSWDDGNPNENLDRVTRLLAHLQGPIFSGQRFVENAETLILVATSHFEPDPSAYVRLLEKVRGLNADHQVHLALTHGAILGSHLRYGFEPFYKRDIALMRADNVPDYHWIYFSLVTLMGAYARMHDEDEHGDERNRVVEVLFSALSPDARAFLGKPLASLAESESASVEFRDLFSTYGKDLLAEFEAHRPSQHDYSPIAFNFNFPHNIVKAITVNAAGHGQASTITLNDLLCGFPRDEYLKQAKMKLLGQLLEYGRLSPEMLHGRAYPILVYDPLLGHRNFTKTMSILKEAAGSAGSTRLCT